MASGHVNRANRPNTWLHRPACDVKKVLANSEPSTHGHFSDVRSGGDHVRSRGQSGPPDFVGRLPKMTPSRTFTVLDTSYLRRDRARPRSGISGSQIRPTMKCYLGSPRRGNPLRLMRILVH